MQVEQYLHDLDDLHDKFQRFGLISAGNSITVVFLFFFQSYGKVVYFITLFPYIVLTTFLIMGLQQVVCWFLYLSQFKFGLMLRFRRNNDNVSPVITDESITSKNNGSICSYHEWFWRCWQSGSLCNWDYRLLLDKEPQFQNRYLDLVVWYWYSICQTQPNHIHLSYTNSETAMPSNPNNSFMMAMSHQYQLYKSASQKSFGASSKEWCLIKIVDTIIQNYYQNYLIIRNY